MNPGEIKKTMEPTRETAVTIGENSAVVLEYSVQLEDGSYVKGENGPVFMNFIAGYGQVLPALELRLTGLEEGTETRFVIPAHRAFGKHDPGLVKRRSFEEFPEGRDLVPGKWIVATNPDTGAQYGYFVQSRDDEAVTLDFNHPLAGKDLYYRVKVVSVRPALPEELQYLRPCEHGEAGRLGG